MTPEIEFSSTEKGYDIEFFTDESQDRQITRSVTLQSSQVSPTLGRIEVTKSIDLNLPPMDRGFHAYSYLVAGFMIELLVWSLPFSYGVFLNHYTTHRLFSHSENLLPLVGTLACGIMYMASVFILPILARYPAYRKSLMYGGLICCVSSLLGAAFATEIWHLILTQGVLYSVGGTILYFPMSVIVFEWFDKKRGLANGIIYSGTYLGGVVVPFIVEILLNKFGLRTTFISLAVGYAIIIALVLPFVRGRLPHSTVAVSKKADWSFVRNSKFIILLIGNLLQGIGNFIPTLWLPTFATDLGLNVTAGTLTIVLMNVSGIPGSIVLGHFADKYDLRIIMLASILGSSLAVLLIWGLGSTLPPLLAFSLIYGFLAAPFSSLWPKFCSVVSTEPHLTVRLMGIFVGSRGIGNILAGPVSTALLHTHFVGSHDHPSYGYQLKNYGPLILFTGITMLTSTVGVLYNNLQRSERTSEDNKKSGTSLTIATGRSASLN